jgi:hypothetical protein
MAKFSRNCPCKEKGIINRLLLWGQGRGAAPGYNHLLNVLGYIFDVRIHYIQHLENRTPTKEENALLEDLLIGIVSTSSAPPPFPPYKSKKKPFWSIDN